MSSDQLPIVFKYRLVRQDLAVAAKVDFTPRKARTSDAGYDVRACIERSQVILPGSRLLIPTGVVVDIPAGYEIQVRPKSGLALKNGLTVLNTPGTVDSGYDGEIGVIIYNTDRTAYEVQPGQKIAQLVPAKLPAIVFIPASENEMNQGSDRGTGGYGSTGVEG